MEISNSAAKRSEDYFYLLLHKLRFQKKNDGMGKIEEMTKGLFYYYKNAGLDDLDRGYSILYTSFKGLF